MAKNNRLGNRKERTKRPKREFKLGYYYIATDTEETEKNYFDGLKENLPLGIKENIAIKVVNVKTKDLVKKALEEASQNPQYSHLWIVFDRDKVTDFDEIIYEARRKDINVAWSNPCFEVWLLAYFGKISKSQDSVACCNEFSHEFKKKTGVSYSKKDRRIYEMLSRYGDEEKAISICAQKFKSNSLNDDIKPSHLIDCTTVYTLVNEINEKVAAEIENTIDKEKVSV